MRWRTLEWSGPRSLVLAGLLATLCTFMSQAQNPAAVKTAEAACGRPDTKFDVDRVRNGVPTPAPARAATVYVIENTWTPRSPIVRVALDGNWVGASRGWSYLVFPAASGPHHLCISKQSRSKSLDDHVALAPLDAKAGHTYYFLADTWSALLPGLMQLDSIDPDEAKLLVAQRPLAVSHARAPQKH